MKHPLFSQKQLDLIGDCVFDSITRLRAARQSIGIEEAQTALQPTIDRLNEILTILADASHE